MRVLFKEHFTILQSFYQHDFMSILLFYDLALFYHHFTILQSILQDNKITQTKTKIIKKKKSNKTKMNYYILTL